MVKRVLVTTALEETWPDDDSPVIFLGEWCRLFDRRQRWESMDAVVAPYHWDDREKLYQDYRDLQIIYEDALDALARKLNDLHGVNHSLRYWRILVGPWLGYFIQVVFDRWYMINKLVVDHEISSAQVLKRHPGECISNDILEFNSIYTDDDWNEMICGQILDYMAVPVNRVCRNNNTKAVRVGFVKRLKKNILKIVAGILGRLARQEEFFFISTYLPIKKLFLLHLKMRQVPKIWPTVDLPRYEYSVERRQWDLFSSSISSRNSCHDFIALLNSLVAKHIPKVYLEGYQRLLEMSDDLNWPKTPKLIVTGVSWNTNDLFKAWSAEKVECGVPLVVLQHGGNYGMARWSYTEDHQVKISDHFLTWGWSCLGSSKVKVLGNFKIASPKKIKINPNGKALLVEMTMPRYSYHMYSAPVSAGQWNGYFKDQCSFVNALPDELKRELLVRLYSNDYSYAQAMRWKSVFPDIRLDLGTAPIANLISRSRLYVSTYNATTYLESLAMDIPTIIFWNPKHWELREGVQPYFDMLEDAGIFHTNPESAARQMMAVWSDVEAWWSNPKTQSARMKFCERFSLIPDDLLNDLFSFAKNSGQARAERSVRC